MATDCSSVRVDGARSHGSWSSDNRRAACYRLKLEVRSSAGGARICHYRPSLVPGLRCVAEQRKGMHPLTVSLPLARGWGFSPDCRSLSCRRPPGRGSPVLELHPLPRKLESVAGFGCTGLRLCQVWCCSVKGQWRETVEARGWRSSCSSAGRTAGWWRFRSRGAGRGPGWPRPERTCSSERRGR